jgi:ribonucleoside-diphosphate reductase alpha chain
VEISFLPIEEKTRQSGFGSCNLTEINGAKCVTKEDFMRATKAASILGTLQAGYTHFPYLGKATEAIVEREALLGVSVTGWMNSPDVLFEEQTMIDGATEVKKWNKTVAKLININQSARTTCTKPAGTTSILLNTASGIHGEHSSLYFRNVQMNEQDDVLKLIQKYNPKMVEKSVWSNSGTDFVVSFPIESPEGSVYKDDLLGVTQLEYVKKAQQYWVEHGTNEHLSVDPALRHNVSNTITVDDWDEVEQYIFDNRYYFAGISLLSSMGDKAYPQAPFTEVLTAKQIYDRYGDVSMFASGLIVDGLKAFNKDLWAACDTINGWGEDIEPDAKERGETLDPNSSSDLLKRDWVRRANKFAINYFNDDILEMTNCLKDCHNFHKWKTIERTLDKIDFSKQLKAKTFVDADTLGAQSCSGGSCEISF